jgi:transcriptional regulator with XRE-family HTH domain
MQRQRCNVELLQKIATRIKQLRQERKISQESFFIDTDIHIARIETGHTNITITTLEDICKYFSISLSDFFSSIE